MFLQDFYPAQLLDKAFMHSKSIAPL